MTPWSPNARDHQRSTQATPLKLKRYALQMSEAGHAIREIPTWMGLTAKWRVRCVSLAEAKDILAGCKRLEQETQK